MRSINHQFRLKGTFNVRDLEHKLGSLQKIVLDISHQVSLMHLLPMKITILDILPPFHHVLHHLINSIERLALVISTASEMT